MYVAIRELRHARGRFLLITTVVLLLTMLVGFLTGLTGGLATRNISAITGVSADRFATAQGAQTLADSALTPAQLTELEQTPGVRQAIPIGISQTRARLGDAETAVAVFGTTPELGAQIPTDAGTVTLSAGAAQTLRAQVGETVGLAGRTMTIAAIGADDWYSHLPVIWTTLADWQQLSAGSGGNSAATVVAIRGVPQAQPAGVQFLGTVKVLTAIGSFRSEIGSLLLIIALLLGISALVVGAFFIVWGMQRRADVAVLKALGASTGSLVRDGLGQALLVLLAGIGAGTLIVIGVGIPLRAVMPFLLSPLTILAPAALLLLLGLAGAALAIRPVTTVDPLTALGSNR